MGGGGGAPKVIEMYMDITLNPITKILNLLDKNKKICYY